MSEPSSLIIGSYQIRRQLGPVPAGRAYAAVDAASGMEVTLKLLDGPEPEQQAEWERELAETRRLGRLSLPGLPVVYEVGDSASGTFVAFSPPPGRSLPEFVAGGGRVDREVLLSWCSELLALLAEAHSQGLLHRHLAVDTVIIGRHGQLGLAGFGFTRMAGDTPEIQPPEQSGGGPLSASSDLYALAALMKRLAAPVELGGACIEELATDDPLLEVLDRATAADPRRRYREAAEMDAALRAAALPPSAGGEEDREAAGTVAIEREDFQEMMRREAEKAAPPAPEAPPAARREVAPPAAAGGGTGAALAAALEGVGKGAARGASRAAAKPAGEVPPAPAAAAAAGTAPAARSDSRRFVGLLAAAVVLLAAAGGGYFWLESGEPVASVATPPPAPAPAPAPAAGPPPFDEEEEQDPVLRLARLLVRQRGEPLFGATTLEPEQLRLLDGLRADVEEMSFPPGAPEAAEPAASIFGENPLLGSDNPLLIRRDRERWLASALANLGPREALAHLRQESARLRRGEVDRARWYEHVAQCEAFCNHVVSGLLLEHVQQVRDHPHLLVLFPAGSATVGGAAQVELAAFLEELLPETRLLLIGRASRTGAREANRELSRRRVESVERYLGTQGVASELLRPIWLGYEPPQLSPELAGLYGLDLELPAEELNQSVLLVAYEEGDAAPRLDDEDLYLDAIGEVGTDEPGGG